MDAKRMLFRSAVPSGRASKTATTRTEEAAAAIGSTPGRHRVAQEAHDEDLHNAHCHALLVRAAWKSVQQKPRLAIAPGRGRDAGAERHKAAERIQRREPLPKASRHNCAVAKHGPTHEVFSYLRRRIEHMLSTVDASKENATQHMPLRAAADPSNRPIRGVVSNALGDAAQVLTGRHGALHRGGRIVSWVAASRRSLSTTSR